MNENNCIFVVGKWCRSNDRRKLNSTTMSSGSSASIVFISDSCFICNRDFTSDLELVRHLIQHARETKFRRVLDEEENSEGETRGGRLTDFLSVFETTFAGKPKLKSLVLDITKESDDDLDDIDERRRLEIESATISSSSGDEEKYQKISNLSGRVGCTSTKRVFEAEKECKVSDCSEVVPPRRSLRKIAVEQRKRKPTRSKKSKRLRCLRAASSEDSSGSVEEWGPIYRCNSCKSVFKDALKFAKHLLSHKKSRPYVCHICEKSFVTKGTLRRHLFMHIGKKSHQCKTCRKRFTMKSLLRTHERSHRVLEIETKITVGSKRSGAS